PVQGAFSASPDLFALRRPGAGAFFPERGVVRRAVSITNPIQVDFDGPESFAPVSATVTTPVAVPNPLYALISTELLDQECRQLAITTSSATNTGSGATTWGVPESRLQPGELHLV